MRRISLPFVFLALVIAQSAATSTNIACRNAFVSGHSNQCDVQHSMEATPRLDFILNDHVYPWAITQDRDAAVAQDFALGLPLKINDQIGLRSGHGSDGIGAWYTSITNLAPIQFSNGMRLDVGTNAVIDAFHALRRSVERPPRFTLGLDMGTDSVIAEFKPFVSLLDWIYMLESESVSP